MLLFVLLNTSRRILLSHLCLSVLFSTLSAPFLMASKDVISIENDEERPKRMRESNTLNEKTKTEEEGWLPGEIAAHLFDSLSFKDIRAGRCVSTSWKRMLTSDKFCTYWGKRFSPSTPQAMGMLPQEFIRYWSTPSVHFLHEGEYKDMSADGSIIVGSMVDDINKRKPVIHGVNGQITYLPGTNGWSSFNNLKVSGDGSVILGEVYEEGLHRPILWINNQITYLPNLNKESSVSPLAINGDGSIIVGAATDRSNNIRTAVQWVYGKITPLPYLNNGDYAHPNGISSDGSIIVGEASGRIRTAVQWISGEMIPLPYLDNWLTAAARVVSSDGSTIAGQVFTAVGYLREASVQWRNGQITYLPNLDDGSNAQVRCISGDGSIIAGAAYNGLDYNRATAVLWDNGQIFSLKKILEEAGFNVEGTHFALVYAISANGLQVIGSAQVNGKPCDFKAVLPSKDTQ